jgi:hypothetical protein
VDPPKPTLIDGRTGKAQVVAIKEVLSNKENLILMRSLECEKLSGGHEVSAWRLLAEHVKPCLERVLRSLKQHADWQQDDYGIEIGPLQDLAVVAMAMRRPEARNFLEPRRGNVIRFGKRHNLNMARQSSDCRPMQSIHRKTGADCPNPDRFVAWRFDDSFNHLAVLNTAPW